MLRCVQPQATGLGEPRLLPPRSGYGINEFAFRAIRWIDDDRLALLHLDDKHALGGVRAFGIEFDRSIEGHHLGLRDRVAGAHRPIASDVSSELVPPFSLPSRSLGWAPD